MTLIEITDSGTADSSVACTTPEDFSRAAETESRCYVGADAAFILQHFHNALECLARGAARYTFQLERVHYSISDYSGRGRH